MKTLTLDQMALLSEEEAVQRDFDMHNFRMFRWLFLGAMFAAFMMAVSFSNSRYPSYRYPQQVPLALLHGVLLLVVFFSRKKGWFEQRFRTIYVSFFAVEYLLAITIFFGHPTLGLFSLLLFPILLIASRLRTREFVYLGALFLASNAIGGLILGNDVVKVLQKSLLLAAIPLVLEIAIAVIVTRGHRERFVGEWRIAASREHERLRMQDELELARQIQVSMLPDAAPNMSWIRFACSSVTASEVGGDFYDIQQLDDDRVALVMGDVAGHGVASGLVLAAIKGGLYLLRDRLADPVAAVSALNAMIRDAIRWRMLVSMLVAVVDRSTGTITVLAAGHPPLLLRSGRTGAVRIVGSGSLPLGTSLPVVYGVESVPVEAGDTLVLATDGFIELSRDGEPFGDTRLVDVLRRQESNDADAVRDALLGALAEYRNGAPLEDDVTLLVATVMA